MIAARRPAPALSAKRIRASMGLSRDRMGRLLGVSYKTIEAWEKEDKLPADGYKRTLLATIDEIRELGLSVYTPEGFVTFLSTPLKVFGNRTALQEIEAGHADLVLGELAADYEGAGY